MAAKTIANIKLVVRAYFAIVVAGNGYRWRNPSLAASFLVCRYITNPERHDMAYIGKNVKDKQVAKIEDELNPLLPEDEKIVAVFWANRMKPLTDTIVLTNQRLLCAHTSYMGKPGGFFNEIIADDIKSPVLEKTFAAAKFHIIRNNGTKEFLASIVASDYENISKVIEKMSGSPQLLNYSEEKKEKALAETRQKYGIEKTTPITINEEEWNALITDKVNKASLREVQQSCRADEMPKYILGDGSTGVLAVFEDRCMVIKKGLGASFMSSSLGGGRVATFAYRDITGIEYNSGILTGVLEILTPSYTGKTTNSPWTFGNDKSAYELSNTLPWSKIFYNQVRPQIEWMQQRIQEVKSAGSQPAVAQVSSSDELSKLAALHKQGVLTDKEFAEAKQKLLSKL